MLTQDKIDSIVIADMKTGFNKIAYDVVRGAIEHGQLVYRFNQQNSRLDTFIFCGFVKIPESNVNFLAALHKGSTNIHANNMVLDRNFIRDLLFSGSFEYEAEAYFLCKEKAERRLKTFRVKQAKDLLIKLEQGE
ncbi:hypothetical protein S14_198 [Shewanella sp. phage 1/4]|uniref:hypothetical protein n=1 Tax=Shewanella phage 1/4 TaxID=1458859 RepID=UPI0004F73E46|nr:hypothetical protein S14_198 [Shewanella sp. phage 1/4]AHK11307.1 hypothetical protein S14_198 [Shewanella sp. phage 1/4]